jgi:outer membrane protein OmpA-like peptidoglycan-associated protein
MERKNILLEKFTDFYDQHSTAVKVGATAGLTALMIALSPGCAEEKKQSLDLSQSPPATSQSQSKKELEKEKVLVEKKKKSENKQKSIINSPYLCDVLVEDSKLAIQENESSTGLVVRPFETRELKGKLAAKTPINKNPVHKRNELDGDSLNIYFRNKAWTLYRNDFNDIATYAKNLSLEQVTGLIVEGHADLNGSENLNDFLSEKRANGVKPVLKRNLKSNRIPVQIVAYGESKAKQASPSFAERQADRKVRIVPNKSVIQRGLDLLVSDYYLVDQSSSMRESVGNGNSKWQEVQKYQFPSGADVYTFSDKRRTCGQNLSTTYPGGGTPLLRSLYDLLGGMEKGKSVTVLTDGIDNRGGVRVHSIVNLANSKNIKVSFIGLGLKGEYKNMLNQIAQSTGGGTYLTNN